MKFISTLKEESGPKVRIERNCPDFRPVRSISLNP
jgi:hypothetical protein